MPKTQEEKKLARKLANQKYDQSAAGKASRKKWMESAAGKLSIEKSKPKKKLTRKKYLLYTDFYINN